MAGGPLDLWNDWSIQILVLLSLTLQVVLFLFAGIRRREAHPLLKLLLWLTYQLADSTAMFALGHLSLGSTPRDHQLAAFWVPFLMLHLGGPDNITAYALEDNQLWLRHMEMLVVQVLGATYVLYKQIAVNGSFVLMSSILIFILGVVKYAERTWALRCGNMDRLRSSLMAKPRSKHHHHLRALDHGIRLGAADKEEFYVHHAHSLFLMCKHAMVDSWIEKDPGNRDAEKLKALKKQNYEVMWTMMEVELSLMYDILYTKAAVVHTWPGYCVRVISPLATAASFLLFHFSGKDGSHSSLDVVVTYTLLSGACFLETTSLLTALGSTWTYAFLCATRWSWLRYTALCTGRWDRLRRLVKMITGRQRGGRARRWSGKMGQYNLLHRCARRDDTAFSPLLGRLANMVGAELKEWWDRKHYSGTIEISDDLRQMMFSYIAKLQSAMNSQGVLRKSWGQVPLELCGLYGLFTAELGVELQEAIIIWHIGTDIYLAKSSVAAMAGDAATEVKAIRALSNYMMFLLIERPYMLPGLAQTRLYQRTCQNLVDLWNKDERPSPRRHENRLMELFRLLDDPNSSSGRTQRDELAILLLDEKPGYSIDVPRLRYARWVAEKLLVIEEKGTTSVNVLGLVRGVWMDFLVYAANRCSRESHAKKLSSGGEMTTILWLMTEYNHNHLLNRTDEEVV